MTSSKNRPMDALIRSIGLSFGYTLYPIDGWKSARILDSAEELRTQLESVFGGVPSERLLSDNLTDLFDVVTSHPEASEHLLDEYQEREAADVRETGVRIDPSIAQRLRAMGYLEDSPDIGTQRPRRDTQRDDPNRTGITGT